MIILCILCLSLYEVSANVLKRNEQNNVPYLNQYYVDYINVRNSNQTCANFVDSISIYCFVLSLPTMYTRYVVNSNDFMQCSQLIHTCDNYKFKQNNTFSQCIYMNFTQIEEHMLQTNTTYMYDIIPHEFAPIVYEMCQERVDDYYSLIEQYNLSSRIIDDIDFMINCVDTKIYNKCISDLSSEFIEFMLGVIPTTSTTTTPQHKNTNKNKGLIIGISILSVCVFIAIIFACVVWYGILTLCNR